MIRSALLITIDWNMWLSNRMKYGSVLAKLLYKYGKPKLSRRTQTPKISLWDLQAGPYTARAGGREDYIYDF
jgi:hypothetical protein